MQVDVLNKEGKKTGRTVELPDEVFAMEPNTHVMYLAAKQFMAAQRQGTHKVKTRMEVHGSSKKLHRQKGTGGSRKGNLRNPLYKGGGTIFGPKPRDYSFKLNRKVKSLAKMSALSCKAKENAIVVVEDLNMEKPATKMFNGIMKNLNTSGKKTLFVMAENNDNLFLSFRNLPCINGTIVSDINTYDIMNADVMVFTEAAAKRIKEDVEMAEA
ncbi:MAG: 50S ribosomal protein L4 [Dinghuibacter sp.]|nr:50S ribosomal protein L4 [Dinghuibacter sp.]